MMKCFDCKKDFPASRMREVEGDAFIDRVYSAMSAEMKDRQNQRVRGLLFMTSGVRLVSGRDICGNCHDAEKRKRLEASLIEDWDAKDKERKDKKEKRKEG